MQRLELDNRGAEGTPRCMQHAIVQYAITFTLIFVVVMTYLLSDINSQKKITGTNNTGLFQYSV